MKIAAVIVTYNRLDLLKKVLNAFDNQTRKLDYVIVVNNASKDDTKIYLEKWEKEISISKKIVINSKTNVGGSGGFYLGTEKALRTDADWIWVSDDDAIPEPDVIEKAEKHLLIDADNYNIVAACSKVMTNGEIAVSNRSIRKMGLFSMSLHHIPAKEYQREKFECDNFSYVGVLMSKKVLEKVGLICKDYFIWRDDVEHSWRISEAGKIFCYSDMVVNHCIEEKDYSNVSWKTFYAYRNDIRMFFSHKKYIYVFTKILSALYKAVAEKNKSAKRLYVDSVIYAFRKQQGIVEKYYPGKQIV